VDHILKAVDDDLGALSYAVAALGDLAVAQVRASVDVFARHDLPAAEKVVRADNALDLQDAEIEKNAVRFIALRQPMADDLRRPIAAMKIAMQLERCGDLAKNIAKRVPRLDKAPTEAQAASISELGRLVAERLAAVIASYRGNDAQGAYEVWVKDTDIDERHEGVVREIVAAMAAAPDSVGDSIHLLFIAKNLERIGDHATNVAELVHYQITGTDLANRPKL
jgi:phosphate transport system protein